MIIMFFKLIIVILFDDRLIRIIHININFILHLLVNIIYHFIQVIVIFLILVNFYLQNIFIIIISLI